MFFHLMLNLLLVIFYKATTLGIYNASLNQNKITILTNEHSYNAGGNSIAFSGNSFSFVSFWN